MTLFLIIIFIIAISLATFIFPKTKKTFILLSIFSVIFFYFFLSGIFSKENNLLPTKDIVFYSPCGNYYNFIVDSITTGRLNIFYNIDKSEITYDNVFLLDTSIYKDKIYLYFGITPVLLFYLPFHQITGLYLCDRALLFVSSCFIFILSLILIKIFLKKLSYDKNISNNIIILTIFVIGLCNLIPFLLIKNFIYDTIVSISIFFLLLSLYISLIYLDTADDKRQNILTFFISLLLCFATGTRPHYVLMIPVFFLFILSVKYIETKNFKKLIKPAIIFLIPCIFYGTLIATYNYLRFDSIFEFGWKYQINEHNQLNYSLKFKDLITGLKNNLFLPPDIDLNTIFSLAKSSGHTIANEYITGIIWSFPFIFILLFIVDFTKKIFQKNKKLFIFILLFILTIIINITVLNFLGMTIRYIFEYLSLIAILCMIIFLFYIAKTKDKLLKKFLNILFILLFTYSAFINIAMLFSKNNFHNYISLTGTYYSSIRNFLF